MKPSISSSRRASPSTRIPNRAIAAYRNAARDTPYDGHEWPEYSVKHAEAVLAYNPDGVFLSNGPGDPAALPFRSAASFAK